MDWMASLFSSSGVSFRSGAVATKMTEGSERQFRLLRYNNLRGKAGNKSRHHRFSLTGHEAGNGGYSQGST
jgi:hypothetical protein